MTEEEISAQLYQAARADPEIEILSWQSIDGKSYFAADIKLRLPNQRRLEPDLIIHLNRHLWLIEVKGNHSEAVADESKLANLRQFLGKEKILRQVHARSGADVLDSDLVLAVAYAEDAVCSHAAMPARLPSCLDEIVHIDWTAIVAVAGDDTLSVSLDEIYLAQQRRT